MTHASLVDASGAALLGGSSSGIGQDQAPRPSRATPIGDSNWAVGNKTPTNNPTSNANKDVINVRAQRIGGHITAPQHGGSKPPPLLTAMGSMEHLLGLESAYAQL
ncbi:unnamed protein product, partial [Hydatigera taeniaeformis]|uniref:Uncharacterized protein n=1 Tax=Hydatigena taeniaeformis TaxID=6205 RepID=A0A0R3WXK8_HYDTA